MKVIFFGASRGRVFKQMALGDTDIHLEATKLGRGRRYQCLMPVKADNSACPLPPKKGEPVKGGNKMNGMVLGFFEKDGWDTCGHGCHWKIEKFVPVVSLAELKEWCKKNRFGYNPPRVNEEELIKWAEGRSKGETRK